MGFSKRMKAGLASLSLRGGLGAPAVVAGGSMNPADDPQLSPAEIVALRFPGDLEDATSPAGVELAVDRDIEQQTLSILAFNPDPLGVPGPQRWASRQSAELSGARA